MTPYWDFNVEIRRKRIREPAPIARKLQGWKAVVRVLVEARLVMPQPLRRLRLEFGEPG